jgi:CDP-4-dehydro-6-deoxyglucose reductase
VLESRQVTEAGAFPIRKMPARVSSLERKSHDVILLRLQLPANDTFNYRPGQYIEFLLRDGSRRSYSMANAPHNLAPAKPPGVAHPATCRAASSPTMSSTS